MSFCTRSSCTRGGTPSLLLRKADGDLESRSLLPPLPGPSPEGFGVHGTWFSGSKDRGRSRLATLLIRPGVLPGQEVSGGDSESSLESRWGWVVTRDRLLSAGGGPSD